MSEESLEVRKDSNKLDDEYKHDWSLHTWQLPLSSKSKLSGTFNIGQLQYVNAQHGSLGSHRWQECNEYNKYCHELDTESKDNNYASIILPAINDLKSDCNKWRCCVTVNKMKAKLPNHNVDEFVTPSDEEIDIFAAMFEQESKLVSSENNKVPCETNLFFSKPQTNQNLDNNSSNCSSSSLSGGSHANVQQTNYNNLKYISNHFQPKHSNVPSLMSIRPRQNSPNFNNNTRFTNCNPNIVTENAQQNSSYQFPSKGQNSESFPINGESCNNNSEHKGSGVTSKYPWQKRNILNNHNNSNNGTVNNNFCSNVNNGAQSFKTASHQLILNQHKQNANRNVSNDRNSQYGSSMGRSLGGRVTSVSKKFVPPVKRDDNDQSNRLPSAYGDNKKEPSPYEDLLSDPRLKNVEAKMVELIMNEVLDAGLNVGWDDIAGLQDAKATIQEVVVWPMLRPDIFTGLRGPPKGVLLFGPPGTGKTMIGKAIASQSGATFFSISASCLTSKWVGEGEKMVRALFGVARIQSPSVIFIDEIDSLLCQRSETEHESSRRLKTEFLVQLDGVGVLSEQVLVVGATNRPQELDEAARRRLVKRLYIPLPEKIARQTLIQKLLTQQRHSLSDADIEWVAQNTSGYSGADVSSVCSEAAMGPIRGILPHQMQHISLEEVRPINVNDFRNSVSSVRASVCEEDLTQYILWNNKYGIVRVNTSA